MTKQITKNNNPNIIPKGNERNRKASIGRQLRMLKLSKAIKYFFIINPHYRKPHQYMYTSSYHKRI